MSAFVDFNWPDMYTEVSKERNYQQKTCSKCTNIRRANSPSKYLSFLHLFIYWKCNLFGPVLYYLQMFLHFWLRSEIDLLELFWVRFLRIFSDLI
jgi:hypothetical protein